MDIEFILTYTRQLNSEAFATMVAESTNNCGRLRKVYISSRLIVRPLYTRSFPKVEA